MMTVADIHNVTFEKAVRGYRAEDVDAFLTQVAQEFDALTRVYEEAQQEKETIVAAMHKDKEDAEKKIYILAEKIEEYRKDEDNLKIALLNAQRLGESVVNEARQKAEMIVNEARSRAQQTEQQLKEVVRNEEKRLAQMQAEVARFKTGILGLYKQHIDTLSQLPVPEDNKAEQVEKHMEQVMTEQPKTPAAQPMQAPVQAHPMPAQQQVAPQPVQVESEPDLIVVAGNRPERQPVPPQHEIFAPQEPQETFDFGSFAKSNAAPQQGGADSFENYQGISFEE